jgi:ketosteroid isomerase-like protein
MARPPDRGDLFAEFDAGSALLEKHAIEALGEAPEDRDVDDPNSAVAEVKAEGIIKPTGRPYHQEYVVFLRAQGGKIALLRELFDPVSAAKAFDISIHFMNAVKPSSSQLDIRS